LSVEFFLIGKDWVHIHWNTPGQNKVRAVKDVRRIEADIRESGLKGWLMESSREHTKMHPIIEKLGGVKYAEDEESFYFKKEIGGNHVRVIA
jgi:hypothetical protein